MPIFERLLANAHPALNKDPLPQPSLHITASSLTTIVVRDESLQIAGQKTYDLSSFKISDLASSINSISGFTANAVGYGSLSGLALVDGIYTTDCTIPIFTSPLWQKLKTIAHQFKIHKKNRVQAHFQALNTTAAGYWLDELGQKLYDVTREANEPDELYAVRVFDFSLAPRLNNVAIQKILSDLGYSSSVDDTGPHAFSVDVTLPTVAPQGFVYSLQDLQDIVQILRGAGIQATIVLNGSLTDSVSTTDAISQTSASESWTWQNFPGANGWIGFSW